MEARQKRNRLLENVDFMWKSGGVPSILMYTQNKKIWIFLYFKVRNIINLSYYRVSHCECKAFSYECNFLLTTNDLIECEMGFGPAVLRSFA